MKAGNRMRLVATAIIVALASEICFAYDEGDFQYWSSTDFSFDINKDWKVKFEEQFRLGESGGHLYHHHSDLGFVYKSFAEWIDLGFNYRLIREKDSSGEWRQENRPHLNVTLKTKLFGLDLSSRSRLEYRDRENKKDLWRYRNKVTIKLPFELTELKLKPYLADEVYFNLDEEGYNRNRIYAGASFGLAKNIKGEIFYLWQSSRYDGGRKNINVIGTGLRFSF